MTYAIHSDRAWPTESQKLLLQATLGEGRAAVDAWRKWRGAHDIRSLDHGSAGILPSLYFTLKDQDIDLDESTLVVLRGNYRQTSLKNLIAKHTLLKVSGVLEKADIKTMVPKGFPLALFYYPDLGARSMGDIDLLIQSKDLTATASLLHDHEWALGKPLPPPGIAPYIHAVHFYHPQLGCVDLHWVPFRVDSPIQATTEFWRRAVCKDVDGRAIRVPDATDLLLQVCFHSRKLDSQARCRWIIDALTLIKGPDNPVDWDVLAMRSHEADIVLPVCDALSYLHQEFGPLEREDVLEQLQSSALTRRNRVTYFEQMREGRAKRGLAELILSHWRRYRGVRRSRTESASWLGFVAYYTQFLKWYWDMSSLKQLPGTAARQLLKRLRRSWTANRHDD